MYAMWQPKGQTKTCVVAPRRHPNHGSFKLENKEQGKHKGLQIGRTCQIHKDDWRKNHTTSATPGANDSPLWGGRLSSINVSDITEEDGERWQFHFIVLTLSKSFQACSPCEPLVQTIHHQLHGPDLLVLTSLSSQFLTP